jgi:hypothetical protein
MMLLATNERPVKPESNESAKKAPDLDEIQRQIKFQIEEINRVSKIIADLEKQIAERWSGL